MASKFREKTNVRLPVREVKNRFSELVRKAAKGQEVIITSHGEARARLSPLKGRLRPLKIDWKWLKSMKLTEPQSPAEDLIRAERDARD